MNILVTGGAGFIGSHTCIELMKGGFNVIVVDNFCNSSRESLNRVEYISGTPIEFFEIDIRNKENLSKYVAINEIQTYYGNNYNENVFG